MQRSRLLAVASILVSVPALVIALTMPTAQAHGWTTSPMSRAGFCDTGAVTGCGPIQWEPQSVEGPKGFPSRGPADGTICSGGLSRFSELDDPRGGNWPATQVDGGSSFTFTWTLTVAHATTSFDYYVTNSGYDPARPLTRAALDTTPFLSVPYGGARPSTSASHTGTLPERSGKHMILAVWTIADTGNAFYQCSDVDFG